MRPGIIMGVAALVVVASTEEGFTGTYGGVESNFEGVRFYIDASVGSLSDPTFEADALARRSDADDATLDRIAAQCVASQCFTGLVTPKGFFRAHEDAMRVLADRGDPLARGLFAAFGQSGQPGQALGAQLTRGLEHLDPQRAATIVRILALVAPDTRRAEEARVLRAFSRIHVADDGRLDAWLAEQAATPTRNQP